MVQVDGITLSLLAEATSVPPEAQLVAFGMIPGVIQLMELAPVTVRWANLGKIFVIGLLPLIGDRLTS